MRAMREESGKQNRHSEHDRLPQPQQHPHSRAWNRSSPFHLLLLLTTPPKGGRAICVRRRGAVTMSRLPADASFCSLEVILKNVSNPSKPRVVSRKELPYSFDVRSSRLRVKGPTSDQTQQVNIGPSSNIHRGTGLPHSFDVRSSKPRVQGANQ